LFERKRTIFLKFDFLFFHTEEKKSFSLNIKFTGVVYLWP